MKVGYVYILASGRNGTLYIGVTGNLEKRVFEHKNHLLEGFTKKYDVTQLVWYAQYDDITDAIFREKQMKEWKRSLKIREIEEMNPRWNDLSLGF